MADLEKMFGSGEVEAALKVAAEVKRCADTAAKQAAGKLLPQIKEQVRLDEEVDVVRDFIDVVEKSLLQMEHTGAVTKDRAREIIRSETYGVFTRHGIERLHETFMKHYDEIYAVLSS